MKWEQDAVLSNGQARVSIDWTSIRAERALEKQANRPNPAIATLETLGNIGRQLERELEKKGTKGRCRKKEAKWAWETVTRDRIESAGGVLKKLAITPE